jgi:anti-sigma B factor antagonist
MRVKTNRLGVATYLTPDGALIEDQLPVLAESVADARARGAPELVVDLRQVPYIDSKGLEYLLDLATELRQAGGSLRLANPTAICKDVFAITGLDQTIPVFEDLESAGQSFL